MAKFQLKNVRLSFPSIFDRAEFNGEQGKFEATFLFPKDDTKTKALVDKHIEAALASAKVKVPENKRCLRDGDDVEYQGYADHWSFKAASTTRPTIIDRNKEPLVKEDGRPYAGCYVNAIVEIWIQNNNYGKRVNANLHGIQFVADGDAFGQAPVDVTDDFDDLEDVDDL